LNKWVLEKIHISSHSDEIIAKGLDDYIDVPSFLPAMKRIVGD
jgi:hypothetical protein